MAYITGVAGDAAVASGGTAETTATRALRRDQHPADLVGAMLFLVSTDSDFMTGQTLVVDGGGVMN